MEMHVFVCLFLCFLPPAFVSMCPEEGICTCEEPLFKCVCQGGQNISLSVAIPKDIEDVFIDGCNSVEFSMGAISFREVRSIELVNIKTLTIKELSFARLRVSSYFRIENVSNFNVMVHGFTGMHGFADFIMIGVHADHVPESSFNALTGIGNFVVLNCSFGKIDEGAFYIDFVTSMTIENCSFLELRNRSFQIYEVPNVTFKNCYFNVTNENSIQTAFSGIIDFRGCFFETLHSGAFTVFYTDKFTFKDCTVNKLGSSAFDHVNTTEEVVFQRNRFKYVEENSLSLCEAWTRGEVEFESENNGFTCDCRLYRMLADKESCEKVINGGYCIESPHVKLSDLTAVVDKENNCVTMNFTDTLLSNSGSKHINTLLLMIPLYCVFRLIDIM